jgi:hypothetical protein
LKKASRKVINCHVGKHLKIERVDKEKLLDRLNELNDETFTPKHQQDIQGVEHDHKEDVMQ